MAASRQIIIKRAYVAKYLSEHPCVDCGEDNPIVLEFDHVRGEKSYNVGWLINKNNSLNTLIGEVEKCDVRCANCHRIKTAKDFGSYRLYTPELMDGYVEEANKLVPPQKLSFEIAQQIRLEYKAGGIGHRKLAKKYSVSRETIRDILKNEMYRVKEVGVA
jgi:hypothetical protein